MSSTKRSRQRPTDASAASSAPASKRLKSSHIPSPSPSQSQAGAATSSSLGFLVDEDARAGKKLSAKLTNGVAQSKSTRVDDSHAAVMPPNDDASDDNTSDEEDEAAAAEVISLSSSSDSSDAEGEGEESDNEPSAPLTNGHSAFGTDLIRTEDTEMTDAVEDANATFGDLLQSRHPDPIDVQKALQISDPNGRALQSHATGGAPNRGTAITGASLGVVLAQALKTKDKDLLEDCFRTNDHSSIRATIQRQQSHQVATLLECIAERIHKRPGRTGKLMIWVQWSLVSHGGYLANQPELMKKLKSLGAVVRDRANGLQPLLHLKGKLDLLSAQLELRKGMQAASRGANADDLDDEENVLYVEGQGQDWSDSDDDHEAEEGATASKRRSGKTLQIKEGDDESSADNDDLASGHAANGAVNGLDEDSEDDTTDEEEGADGMLDIEAEEQSGEEEESSNDEADSDAPSEDEEDEEDSDAEESDEPQAVRQVKHSTLNRKR